MATQVDLGKIRPVWKGDWAASTAYEQNDMVKVGVHSYICTAAHTSGSTFADTNWDTLAVGAELPSQTGNAGKALRTDGTNLSWGTAGGVLQVKKYNYTTFNYVQNNSYVSFGLDISITPVAADSRYWIEAWMNIHPYNHDSNAVFNIHDSALGSDMNNQSQHCFQYYPVDYYSNNVNMGYMNQWSHGSISSPDDYRSEMVVVNGLYIPSSASSSTRTFKTVMRNHLDTSSNGYYINRGFQDHSHQSVGTSHITVWELSSGVVA